MQAEPQQKIAVTVDRERIIKIVGERMFTDPYAPLREYIANARDASINRPDAVIQVFAAGDHIRITDRGCGMSRQVIIQGFTRVAGRFAVSDRSIGMFGLGVLSAFMISSHLEVETRSADESHGWRVRWNRGESEFSLSPIQKEVPGTDARLFLLPNCRQMADEGTIVDYIRANFGLFAMPIVIGNQSAPVNPAWAWFAAQKYDDQARLLESGPVSDLLSAQFKKQLIATYAYHGSDGVRIFLGIPKAPRHGFGLHQVVFYSNGIRIREGARGFFPENLAFVVGAVDNPGFALQIGRDGFLEDEHFRAMRNSIGHHITRCFNLIAESDPRMLADIMRTHQAMMLAQAQHQPEVGDLFREYYLFDTTIGPRSWRALASEVGGMKDPKLYVLTEEGRRVATLRMLDGLLVVATTNEYQLLKSLASESGVRLKDSTELLNTPASVPAPFHDLARRLAIPLLRSGVNSVEFFYAPGQDRFPASLRLKIERTNSSLPDEDRYKAADPGDGLEVDALLLNTAHPAVQQLAGLAALLGMPAINRAADLLYAISALQSPVDTARAAVTGMVVDDLIHSLAEVGGFQLDRSPSSNAAKCFVALPYATEFQPIWHALRNALEKPPFRWTIVRADLNVAGSDILSGIGTQIAAANRFIADLSGLNINVVLELGMMLQSKPQHTLIICDQTTFARFPADLRGQVPLVYPDSLRADQQQALRWLEEGLKRYPLFISMHGLAEDIR